VAATGFGYYAWAVAVEDGVLKKEDALTWMHEAVDFLHASNPKKNRGWLYHFVTPTGESKFNGEVSTIDSALYYLAARKAAQKLGDKALLGKVEEQIRAIDVGWMMQDGLFRHGLTWEGDKANFLTWFWDDYNEGVLLYKFFGKPFKPRKTEYGLPLFVYYYPLCFYDDQEYRDNLDKAVKWQMRVYNCCGVTACDGPNGYCVNDPAIVSPLAVWACSVYDREAQAFLAKLPAPKTIPSLQRTGGWQAKDRIGIDHGSCLMILRH